ncbi:hypothetical protein QR680_017823 [Steinernema hermaphroditum]|uniref:Uncharacterized protein n=1 Tax=Steinernema hermaphroditum TaxID=289476 RepID=A0AA39HFY3_9BILA|nr:hypothetical protein QR680_017823 [Steinernema hermaphroditum]
MLRRRRTKAFVEKMGDSRNSRPPKVMKAVTLRRPLTYVVVQRSMDQPLSLVLMRLSHDDSAPVILKTSVQQTEYQQNRKPIPAAHSAVVRLDWGDKVQVNGYRAEAEWEKGNGGFWIDEKDHNIVEIETSNVALEVNIGWLARTKVQKKIERIDHRKRTIEIDNGFVFDRTRTGASTFHKLREGMVADCDFIRIDADYWVSKGKRFAFPDGEKHTPDLLKKHALQVSGNVRCWTRLYYHIPSKHDKMEEEAERYPWERSPTSDDSDIDIHLLDQPDRLVEMDALVEVDQDGEGVSDQSTVAEDTSTPRRDDSSSKEIPSMQFVIENPAAKELRVEIAKDDSSSRKVTLVRSSKGGGDKRADEKKEKFDTKGSETAQKSSLYTGKTTQKASQVEQLKHRIEERMKKVRLPDPSPPPAPEDDDIVVIESPPEPRGPSSDDPDDDITECVIVEKAPTAGKKAHLRPSKKVMPLRAMFCLKEAAPPKIELKDPGKKKTHLVIKKKNPMTGNSRAKEGEPSKIQLSPESSDVPSTPSSQPSPPPPVPTSAAPHSTTSQNVLERKVSDTKRPATTDKTRKDPRKASVNYKRNQDDAPRGEAPPMQDASEARRPPGVQVAPPTTSPPDDDHQHPMHRKRRIFSDQLVAEADSHGVEHVKRSRFDGPPPNTAPITTVPTPFAFPPTPMPSSTGRCIPSAVPPPPQPPPPVAVEVARCFDLLKKRGSLNHADPRPQVSSGEALSSSGFHPQPLPTPLFADPLPPPPVPPPPSDPLPPAPVPPPVPVPSSTESHLLTKPRIQIVEQPPPVDIPTTPPPPSENPGPSGRSASSETENYEPGTNTLELIQQILPKLTKYRQITLTRRAITTVDGGDIVSWRIHAICDTD